MYYCNGSRGVSRPGSAVVADFWEHGHGIMVMESKFSNIIIIHTCIDTCLLLGAAPLLISRAWLALWLRLWSSFVVFS